MPKPLIAELAAAARPTQYFPQPGKEAAEAIAALPATQRRQAFPAIAALDEATLRGHFADLAAIAPSMALEARAAALTALARFHPAQPAPTVQGLLEVAHEVARALAAMTGIDRFTLQPPTLAAAERAALLVARASFARTQPGRNKLAGPVGSTALATAADIGLAVQAVPRSSEGDIDVDALLGAVGPSTVAVVASWLTPGGAIERNLTAAAEVAHAHGALMCVEATGLAALVGRTRLREAGADVAWLSLRELCPTATTAALGVRTPLTEFLPGPLVGKTRGGYELDDELPGTIGFVGPTPANVADALAVYVRLRTLGEAGLREQAERLVLDANLLARDAQDVYPTVRRRPLAARS